MVEVLAGPLGWLLLGGSVLGAVAALAATYWFGGRWGTALLAIGGAGLGAALLSYGAILYLRFFLIERYLSARHDTRAWDGGSSGRGSFTSSARGWSVAGAPLPRRQLRPASLHP